MTNSPSRPELDLSDLVPLGQVPNLLPERAGRRFHRSAVFRWAQHGKGGIRLRTVKVGRTACTTKAWLTEFILATGGSAGGEDGALRPKEKTNRMPRPRSTVMPSLTEAKLRRHGMIDDEEPTTNIFPHATAAGPKGEAS